jgi:cytochrome b561
MMKLKNDSESWGWPARALHWTMAVLILFLLGVGFFMTHFVDNMITRFELAQTHKSFGFVVFALGVVRIVWRVANPLAPAQPVGGKPWEAAAARLTHLALYVLMILMPVSGWLMASASPLNDANAYPAQIRNMVFGLFELPDPIAPGDKALEAAFHAIHFYGALALATLLLLHAGAALKHHLVDRDAVLRRMLWGR